jgi:hypothetical protein
VLFLKFKKGDFVRGRYFSHQDIPGIIISIGPYTLNTTAKIVLGKVDESTLVEVYFYGWLLPRLVDNTHLELIDEMEYKLLTS